MYLPMCFFCGIGKLNNKQQAVSGIVTYTGFYGYEHYVAW